MHMHLTKINTYITDDGPFNASINVYVATSKAALLDKLLPMGTLEFITA